MYCGFIGFTANFEIRTSANSCLSHTHRSPLGLTREGHSSSWPHPFRVSSPEPLRDNPVIAELPTVVFFPHRVTYPGSSTPTRDIPSLATFHPRAFSTPRRFSPNPAYAGLFHPTTTSRVHTPFRDFPLRTAALSHRKRSCPSAVCRLFSSSSRAPLFDPICPTLRPSSVRRSVRLSQLFTNPFADSLFGFHAPPGHHTTAAEL
jgi:hypothetical protein